MIQFYFLIMISISLAACAKRDIVDATERGGYPRTYPVASPNPTSSQLEKPNVEEEYFETQKMM